MQANLRSLTALTTFGALALAAHPAHAALVIEADPSTTLAGGSGAFDVNLLDTDPSGSTPYQISAFSFELSVQSASGIAFTGADTSTSAQYIFGTYQSGPAPFAYAPFPSTASFPLTDFIASDASMTGPDYATTLNSGDTLGLGHISYSVAPGTPTGPVAVSIVSNGTSLANGNGNNISFTTQDGTITVANASPAPEPSEVGMLALMACGLGGLMLRARRRAA